MDARRSAPRRFVVWMHAPEHPLWHMPEASLRAIREALGRGWEVRSVDVPLFAAGDGPERIPNRLREEVRDAEVYCGFGIQREAFLAARRLRWVHSGAAGVGGSLFPEMRESDVLLTNSAGIHAEPMAEHALAMILHFARGLDVAAAGKRERRWRHPTLTGHESPVVELGGARLGVVGYGGIGRAVGRRGAALGMRVRAIRRSPGDLPAELERLDGPEGLDDLLRWARFVVLTVPETEETRGLIGGPELGLMGEDAVLINLARGGVVDEEALTEALAERRLRGAGLDVFRREPLPPGSRLWTLENVLITPHTASVSPVFWRRETALILRNIGRYLAGEELENLVSKERGY